MPILKHQAVDLWECPGCGFRMDAIHLDVDRPGYTCPNCGGWEAP